MIFCKDIYPSSLTCRYVHTIVSKKIIQTHYTKQEDKMTNQAKKENFKRIERKKLCWGHYLNLSKSLNHIHEVIHKTSCIFQTQRK